MDMDGVMWSGAAPAPLDSVVLIANVALRATACQIPAYASSKKAL
jgi:hypothetical protein